MKLIKFLVFLFPVFFALPDLAIDLGFINLRYDDIVIYLLFIFSIFVFFRVKQHFFIKIQFYLLIYVLVSLVLAFTLYSNLISAYEVTRTLGSVPYLLVLPYLFDNKEYRRYLFAGAFVGGIIYLTSIFGNYNRIVLAGEIMKTHSDFKNHMSFSTLNPNSVATIALLFAFLNIVAFSEKKSKPFLILGVVLLFVPFFVFARGSSIGMLVAVAMLVLFQKKNLKKYLFYLISFVVIWVAVSKFINKDLLASATKIDITTGEGTSGRFMLWKQGLSLIKESPIFGNGFATENGMYIKYYDGHMAHQILLHYAIELGIIVLIIFVVSMWRLIIDRIKLYMKTNNLTYLIQFSMIVGFFVADMTGQLLYFNKYAFIIFVMATYNPLKSQRNHVQ